MNHHVSCQNHIFSWSIHGQISVLSQCFTIAHHVSRCFIIFHHQVRPPRCGERLGFMGDITQLGQFHHLLRPSIQGKNHQQASDYWSGMFGCFNMFSPVWTTTKAMMNHYYPLHEWSFHHERPLSTIIQGLVNVPMFHITQKKGIFHLQQIFGLVKQIPNY